MVDLPVIEFYQRTNIKKMIYCDRRFVGLIKTCRNTRCTMTCRKDNRFVMSSWKLLSSLLLTGGPLRGGRADWDGWRAGWGRGRMGCGPERNVHTFPADPLCSAACTQVNDRTPPLPLVKLIGRWFDEGHSQKTSPASQLIRNKEEQRRGSINSKRGLPC